MQALLSDVNLAVRGVFTEAEAVILFRTVAATLRIPDPRGEWHTGTIDGVDMATVRVCNNDPLVVSRSPEQIAASIRFAVAEALRVAFFDIEVSLNMLYNFRGRR